jgi:hypothetical protein
MTITSQAKKFRSGTHVDFESAAYVHLSAPMPADHMLNQPCHPSLSAELNGRLGAGLFHRAPI